MPSVIRAPEFPSDAAWLNTGRPLRFAEELKGQVVLLDFWTYCCINCMHVLPDLAFLEAHFRDEPVAVIGVHSNKFANEAAVEAVTAAVARYEVHHPVVVDDGHRIWDSFAVRSWPTLILIGADGRVIGQVSGEGHRTLLQKSIERALADARARVILAAAPLPEMTGAHAAASGETLSFPAKVIPDFARRRLFIVDSNHHRILITSWPDAAGDVDILASVGSGICGSADGPLQSAAFNRPQGAVLNAAGTLLFVADTENHLVRRVDLEKGNVTTLLGKGHQLFDHEAGKSGREQGLNSPWDLALLGNRLYIAQAGQHQIFATNLMTGMTEVAAGSARENLRDGPALDAQLAQPSGLALDAKNQILYFADSEVSAVRALDLREKQVFTLIGHGLFDFGDVDGGAQDARFQHCLGVALAGDGRSLLLADTYNHKIKRIDPATRTVETVAGTGARGRQTESGAVQFFEPASVVPAGDGSERFFVADTNNHRIVRVDPSTGAWQTLSLRSGAADRAG